MTDSSMFDFKKAQKELIRQELRPILYEQGFILSKPTTYVRECNGLLQEFYFKVETSKLRPWVSCRPIFDSRDIVSFGTDSVHTTDASSPYYGYGWVSYDGWMQKKETGFREQFLPRFHNLKQSIINGMIPELNKLNSLDMLINLYQEEGLLFQRSITHGPGVKIYYDFVSKVYYSVGMERMHYLLKTMEEWNLQNLPKTVREYLTSHQGCINSDEDADRIFEEYCDKIRVANKLKLTNI